MNREGRKIAKAYNIIKLNQEIKLFHLREGNETNIIKFYKVLKMALENNE